MKRLLTTILALCLFIPASSAAQTDDDGFVDQSDRKNILVSCRKFRKTLRSVRPTPEQKELLVPLLQEYRANIDPLMPELNAAKLALFNEIFHPENGFDSAALSASYHNFGDQQLLVVTEFAETLDEVRGILSEEQYDALVKARTQAYTCAQAPARIYRGIVINWMKR